MVIQKEFVGSQPRNESGFIVPVAAKTEAEKQILAELRKYKAEIKNSGQKLNRDFYDQVDAIGNYAIINAQGLAEVQNNILALKNEVANGVYERKEQNTQKPYTPKQTSIAGTANTQAPQTQGEKKEFKPLLNDKGFVIVIKPKNENQALIAQQFDEFYDANIANSE